MNDYKIYDIVNYCRVKLNIPNEVYIEATPLDLTDDGVVGWTFESGEDGEYEIEIERTLNIRELVTTICHEMVHVKQLFEGRELNEDEAYGQEGILSEGYFNRI